MNTEHTNTSDGRPIPDDVWDVFLPDGDDEPLPEEGDFWFEAPDEE